MLKNRVCVNFIVSDSFSTNFKNNVEIRKVKMSFDSLVFWIIFHRTKRAINIMMLINICGSIKWILDQNLLIIFSNRNVLWKIIEVEKRHSIRPILSVPPFQNCIDSINLTTEIVHDLHSNYHYYTDSSLKVWPFCIK